MTPACGRYMLSVYNYMALGVLLTRHRRDAVRLGRRKLAGRAGVHAAAAS